jgi:hypothetical protein
MKTIYLKFISLIFIFALFCTTSMFSQHIVTFKNKKDVTLKADIDLKKGCAKHILDIQDHINQYGFEKSKPTPQTIDKLGRQLIDDYQTVLKTSSQQVRMKKADTDGEWWFVDYEQTYSGLSVDGSEIGFTVDPTGKIVSLGAQAFTKIDVSTAASISTSQAIKTSSQHFQCDSVIVKESPHLVILPIENDSSFTYKLAWKLELKSVQPYKDNIYYIDGIDGKIIKEYSNLKDISMNVKGKITGDYYPVRVTDATKNALYPTTSIKIFSSSMSLVAEGSSDDNGNYSISFNGGSGVYFIWIPLINNWIEVDNSSGTLIKQGKFVSVGNPVTVNANWSAGDESNVSYHVTRIHSFYKSTPFNYNGMDYKMIAQVGTGSLVNGSCDGTNLTFGSQNGQSWARSSDVVYHEYTHGVIHHIYGGFIGNGTIESASMDEGLADYFACTINNDPAEAEDCGLTRNLSNTYQFDPTKSDAIHWNGQVIGGACWDLRQVVTQSICDNLVFKALQISPHAHNYSDFLNNVITADKSCYSGSHYIPIKVAFANHGIGGTRVSGTISNNTTLAGYIVVGGNVIVNSGVTLTISPGAVISFANGTSLTVNGTLNAQGTSSSIITFTSTGAISSGSWGSVILNGSGTSGSNLNYITMQYGTDIQFLNGANGTLQNSAVNNCARGVYVYNSNANISGNSFQDNLNEAIYCNGSGYTHQIHVNTITKTSGNPQYHQQWGIGVSGASYGYISRNDISGFSYGMYIAGGATSYFLKNQNLPYTYPNNRVRDCNYAVTAAWGGSVRNDAYYYMWYSSIYNNVYYDLYAYQSGSIYSRYDYYGGGSPRSYKDGTSTIDVLYPLSYNPWGAALSYQSPDNSATESHILAKSTTTSIIQTSAIKDENVDEGFEFEKQKNYAGAIEYYQSLIKNGKVSQKTLAALAHFGAEAGNKDVTNYFETLKITKNEHQPFVMELLAGLYTRQGENQKSAAIYDEIIKAFSNTYHEKLAWFQKFYYTLHVEKNNAKALYLLNTIKSKYSNDDDEGNIERAESIFNSAGELKKKGAEERIEPLTTYELLQNYPNPFNPTTIISYQLSAVSNVSLKVYDILGREVATLANGTLEAGYHTATFDGSGLSSGVYFVRLTSQPADGSKLFSKSMKILMTK